jgi:TolB-like protein
MLQDDAFRASKSRREMLRYIVEETLAGREDRLKGVTLAFDVFGRDETFDQQSDPVVRIEARRLRTDLSSYYVDAGREDPVRITIPKGHYVPHFAWQNREARAPAPPPRPNLQDAPLQSTDAPAPPVTDAATPHEPSGKRPILVAALLVVGGLFAIGAAIVRLHGADPDVATARTPAIIVLPFEAFGDTEDIELIASSVTEELIANLMLFKDFRVYSAASSFRLEANADPATLGRDLGVSFVVSGLMQAQGGQVRILAKLVDSQTGEVRWNGNFHEALAPDDLFRAQHDLAVAISTALGEPFGAVNQAIGRRMASGDAPSMPSYACLLRAYEYRRTFEDALHAPAMACLKETVVRDPEYADAWAMLGWLHLDAVRNDLAPTAEHPAEMAAAFEAASHAVALKPKSPRTLAALSVITFYQGDYATAEDLQRQVLALNPYDPEALAQLGWRMAVRGNREGLDYLEQAIARSANPPGWYSHLIAVYAYLDGDYARALEAAEKSAVVGSAMGLSFAAMSHAKLGHTEAAQDALAAMAAAWPLMGRDPATAYRMHQASDEIVEALVAGLREAGWTPPDGASP